MIKNGWLFFLPLCSNVRNGRALTRNTKIRRGCEREICYGSDGPVMYAQTLTKTSVRHAPANPETRNLI